MIKIVDDGDNRERAVVVKYSYKHCYLNTHNQFHPAINFVYLRAKSACVCLMFIDLIKLLKLLSE